MVRPGPAQAVLTVSLLLGWPPAALLAQTEPPAVAAERSARSPIDYGTARLERRLEAVRATGDITLDGALDEPSWSGAPVASHFVQNDPREGEPATFDTEVRILYVDEALYFGVFAHDGDT